MWSTIYGYNACANNSETSTFASNQVFGYNAANKARNMTNNCIFG